MLSVVLENVMIFKDDYFVRVFQICSTSSSSLLSGVKACNNSSFMNIFHSSVIVGGKFSGLECCRVQSCRLHHFGLIRYRTFLCYFMWHNFQM